MRASDQADQDDNMSSDESGSDQESMEVKEIKYRLLSTCLQINDIFQVDEVEKPEPRKEMKITVREKFKTPDVSRRPPRSDEPSKSKKDRTLDPMDPASYSDIPR